MSKLKVTLVRSTLALDERQLGTVKGLGLRKIGQSRVLANTPAIRGMIKSVHHLLRVEETPAADS